MDNRTAHQAGQQERLPRSHHRLVLRERHRAGEDRSDSPPRGTPRSDCPAPPRSAAARPSPTPSVLRNSPPRPCGTPQARQPRSPPPSENAGTTTMRDLRLTLDLPHGWTATGTSTFAKVEPGKTVSTKLAGDTGRLGEAGEFHLAPRRVVPGARERLQEQHGGDRTVALRIVVPGSECGRRERCVDVCPGQLRRIRQQLQRRSTRGRRLHAGRDGHRAGRRIHLANRCTGHTEPGEEPAGTDPGLRHRNASGSARRGRQPERERQCHRHLYRRIRVAGPTPATELVLPGPDNRRRQTRGVGEGPVHAGRSGQHHNGLQGLLHRRTHWIPARQ